MNISALQKSIRRGDAELAMRYAQQGCTLDPEQVFRRLAACAVEDVGIGNLPAVGMALTVMGDRSLRTNGAPEELAAYLAYILAISPKSRLACDLLSLADYDRAIDPLKRRLANGDDMERRSWIADCSKPIGERMVSAWLHAGTDRFRGSTMPRHRRQRTDFMRVMAASRMPLMFYYIADRCAGRLSDAMFVSWLFIAEMLASDPRLAVASRKLDSMMIAGFPASAYDLHTYEGRIALGQFARNCQPVEELLRGISPTMRDTATRIAFSRFLLNYSV